MNKLKYVHYPWGKVYKALGIGILCVLMFLQSFFFFKIIVYLLP